METLIYYSRNRKKPPFEVTIRIDGQIAYIDCNCPLGLEKKICRHKINAIRGDKEKRAESTDDAVIVRLRSLFGPRSTLRQHLEEKWRMLRIYAGENPDKEEEIEKKRKILGEAFANGFVNVFIPYDSEPFDAIVWEGSREIYADGLDCQVTLKYESGSGEITDRKVDVTEVFINDSRFYIYGYCHLRKEKRTFRADRVHGLTFQQDCSKNEKSTLLDVIFQGNPRAI